MPYTLREYWNNLGLLQQGYLVVLAAFCLLIALAFGYCLLLRFAKASSNSFTNSKSTLRLIGLVRAAHEILILLVLLAAVVSSAAVLSELDSVSLSKTSLSATHLEAALRLPTQLILTIFVVLTIAKLVLWFTAGLAGRINQGK